MSRSEIQVTFSTIWKSATPVSKATRVARVRAPVATEKPTAATRHSSGRRRDTRATTRAPMAGSTTMAVSSGNEVAPSAEARIEEHHRTTPRRTTTSTTTTAPAGEDADVGPDEARLGAAQAGAEPGDQGGHAVDRAVDDVLVEPGHGIEALAARAAHEGGDAGVVVPALEEHDGRGRLVLPAAPQVEGDGHGDADEPADDGATGQQDLLAAGHVEHRLVRCDDRLQPVLEALEVVGERQLDDAQEHRADGQEHQGHGHDPRRLVGVDGLLGTHAVGQVAALVHVHDGGGVGLVARRRPRPPGRRRPRGRRG